MKRNYFFLLIISIILLGVLFRTIYIVADPPSDLSISGALIGDAGQHSYGARNKILFNQWSFNQWKPYLTSPLIDIPVNYIIFKIFGINFYSHKSIPLIFSILTLILFLLLLLDNFNKTISIIGTILFSINYPTIIFSKVGNRYMPMSFFFLLSIFFLTKAIKNKKQSFFIISGISFMLSYFSQNHILYQLTFFIILFFLLYKKNLLNFKNLLSFFIPIIILLSLWYFAIFIPNSDFFYLFINHNKLVRNINSLKQVFNNILNSPFLFQFKSSIILLLLSSFSYFYFIKKTLLIKKSKEILITISFIWLTTGLLFHSIWNYRPTRFYLILIPPASILSSWFLYNYKKSINKQQKSQNLFINLLIVIIILFFFGIKKYFIYIIKNNFSYIIITATLLFFLIAISKIYYTNKNITRISLILILLSISIITNSYYFFKWAYNREYKIINISKVLKKISKPTIIAGNWASILSIGTPHKTYLLSGEMKINWRKNFLIKNNVKYLLLTKGNFSNEIKEYKNFFIKDFKKYGVLAHFRLYNTSVLLYRKNIESNHNIIEIETFFHNKGEIVFSRNFSNNLSLKIYKNTIKKSPLVLLRNLKLTKKIKSIRLSLKNKIKGIFEIIQHNKLIYKRNFEAKYIYFTNFKDINIKEKITLKFTITNVFKTCNLDKIIIYYYE